MPPKARPERRCNICHKVFGKTEHLERHIRSHTKDKPFTCNVCHKSFSRNDTLLRHWRSHGAQGPPPASSVTQARRPLNQAPQQQQQTANNQAQQTQPAVQQQALPDFNAYHAYPPIDMQGMQGVQAYGQNVPDRHTEAASALLSLPQASFASNPQDGTTEVPQGFPESELPQYHPAGQDGSSQQMMDFSADQLDPMLSMTAAEGEATMNAHAANQYAQSQQPQSGQVDYTAMQENYVIDYGTFDASLESALTDAELAPVAALFAKSQAPTINGSIVKDELPAANNEELTGTWYDDADNKVAGSPASFDPSDLDFLKSSIRTFFSRFVHVFPVVHPATFRPSQNLLLSKAIATIGSLLVGPHSIIAQSQAVAQLDQDVAAAWQKDVSDTKAVDLQSVQAGLLAGLYDLLSGSQKNAVKIESKHVNLATWAASLGEIDVQDTLRSLTGESVPSAEEVEQIWRVWAEKETRLRVLHGLRILDVELANLFSREPSVPFDVSKLPLMCPDELFQAWSGQEWLNLIRTRYPVYLQATSTSFELSMQQYTAREQAASRFAALTSLEGINSDVVHARVQGTFDENKAQEVQSELLSFFHRFCADPHLQSNDTFSLVILWHATFIHTLVDYHILEGAFGKKGSEAQTSAHELASQWAASDVAQRCLTHAVLIEHHVNNLRSLREPAIHVPRALFIAALTTLSQARFGSAHPPRGADGLSFPEFDAVAQSLAISPPSPAYGGPDITHRLRDLLFRLGHLEIARSFGNIIEILTLCKVPDVTGV